MMDFNEEISIDLNSVSEYRQIVKGRSPQQKIEILRKLIVKEDLIFKESNEFIIHKWMVGAHQREISRRFGKNHSDYLLEGGKELIEYSSAKGFKLFGLTANLQPQALWLMEFVSLKKCFSKIVGFPERVHENVVTKGDLLRDFIIKENLLSSESCAVIGDGYTDILAGKKNEVYTVGIANDFSNGVKLLESGCDCIATSTSCYRKIIEVIRKY